MMTKRLRKKWRQRLMLKTPGQLVVQMTDRCNAGCPQCGMRVTSDFKRSTLDRKTLFRIIDAAAAGKVKAISFTGGEPLLMLEELCACINRAAAGKIPWIRTGTNGFIFSGSHRPGFKARIARIAEKLAATRLRNFWISIDSSDPHVHDAMRGFDRLMDGIEKALPIFHDAGLYPSANLGINRNLGGDLTRNLCPGDFSSVREYASAVYEIYSRGFSSFYETIIDLGFTIVNACYPMSVDVGSRDLDAVYRASAVDDVVSFKSHEKTMIFKALRDTIPQFRNRIRIFSPLVSINALVKEYGGRTGASSPCQGGINFFFIDAGTGNTFPCGFRGRESFGKFWDGDLPGKTVQADCRSCDWECFRDPSELTAPVLDLLSAPLAFAIKNIKDPGQLKLWIRDLLYYQACDFFDGRLAPDYRRLARCSPGSDRLKTHFEVIRN